MKGQLQDVTDLFQGSVDTALNAVIVSPPGWGKSEMAYKTAVSIYGEDSVLFVEIAPSTPPEAIEGPVDIVALREGTFVRRRERTLYDQSVQIVVLDELFRADELLLDSLLHATQPVVRGHQPIFWGTASFVPREKRFEALRERFALWLWWSPTFTRDCIISDLALSIRRHNGTPVMTEQDAAEAAFAVAEVAIQNGFSVSPRLWKYWYKIFTFCEQPYSVLRFAYPSATAEEATKWYEIVKSVSDPETTAINSFLTTFNARVADIYKMPRDAGIVAYGDLVASAERSLSPFGERGAEVIGMVKQWFLDYVAGSS